MDQSYVAWLVVQAVDVPDNIQEVLSACVLLYLVRVLVNRLASRLPRPPAAAASGAGAPAPAIVGAAKAVTAAKTAPAQGAAVLVGAPSSPVKSRDAGLAAAAPAASAVSQSGNPARQSVPQPRASPSEITKEKHL